MERETDLFHINTIQYNTIQYNTIQYNTIQYNTIQYNTIQYNTIQYNTIFLIILRQTQVMYMTHERKEEKEKRNMIMIDNTVTM